MKRFMLRNKNGAIRYVRARSIDCLPNDVEVVSIDHAKVCDIMKYRKRERNMAEAKR